jgi:hypothetical protein
MHEDLSRDELHKLIQAYTKSWLAHDGCWFLAAEEARGIDEAIKLDEGAWARFAPIEAKRVMEARGIDEGGGLPALAEALSFRMYSFVNKQEVQLENGLLIFRMLDCRVQSARRRKGLSDFPCKSVGIIEFSNFAKTVDPRIATKCVACPPDELAKDEFCTWEFTIE